MPTSLKSLNFNQLVTWQQAYHFSKEEKGKGIVFGKLPETKSGRAFFAPFIKAGYINKNTLKYAGVFVLTEKGITKFEELLCNL